MKRTDVIISFYEGMIKNYEMLNFIDVEPTKSDIKIMKDHFKTVLELHKHMKGGYK